MVAIKNLFYFAAAAQAVVLPRGAAQALTDLKTIDTDTNKLTNATNSWNGQVFTSTTISNAESQLETDIKTATKNAAGYTASSADSKTIVTYVNGTLEPDVRTSLAAIQAKKAQFKAAGLSNTVITDLNNLKNLTAQLSSALISVSSSDQKANGQTLANKLQTDFNNEITAFSA